MPDYPGWNLDLRFCNDDSNDDRPIGIHHSLGGQNMLTKREVAMMRVCDLLTDKPDWHLKIFNQEIAEKWRQEAALSDPVLDEECAAYCILELRDKAEHFCRTGMIPTLDAGFGIAKSDSLVPPELQVALREVFARLKADNSSNPDWHPWTGNTVQDLVHPSMYPLVYGRSLFIPDEVVGVEDAIDKWAGKGEVIPRRPEWGEEGGGKELRLEALKVPDSYWSTTYQWLPANVKFTDDGDVQFTSYINNLHPNKYRDVYRTIEKLIKIALPMWDQCFWGTGLRIALNPSKVSDENDDNWDPSSEEEMLAREKAAKLAEQAAKEAADPAQETVDKIKVTDKERDSNAGSEKEQGEDEIEQEEEEEEDYRDIRERWKETRKPVQPRPRSYKKKSVGHYTPIAAGTLREQFKDTGLQIIVKMASIELTPENPTFSPGNWHIEGQMNEHIVGTALYYLDSENITDTSLDFRTMTHHNEEEYWFPGQDAFSWMETIFGTRLRGDPCIQNYGSVATPQGRLLAFPNVFQHCVSGFQLQDPTKPGHRRFIALWLVDPLTRIISTANVPPQQAEWWADRVFNSPLVGKDEDEAGSSRMPPEIAQLLLERGIGQGLQLTEAMARGKTARDRLPPELMDMVRKELGDWPMSREEAEKHRLELMDIRSAFRDDARERWEAFTYSFCEH